MKKLFLILAFLLFLTITTPAGIKQMSGFEVGNSTECQNLSGTASFQTSIVHAGTYAFQSNPTTSSTGYIRFQGITSTGEGYGFDLGITGTIYFQFYFRMGTIPASGSEIFCRGEASGNSKRFDLRVNSSGHIILSDDLNTDQATGTTTLVTNVWYRISGSVATGTGSAFTVYINNTSEITGTGTFGGQFDQFVLGKITNTSSQTVNFYYDDLVIYDSGLPPDGVILNAAPISDGTYTTWTIGAGSGSKWQIVGEIPPDGDTSYLLSDGTINHAYTANLQTSTTLGIQSTATVNAVKAWNSVRDNGAGGSNYRLRLRSNTTDNDTVNTSSNGTYGFIQKFYTTDPATSASWTVSGLDTLQTGAVDGSGSVLKRMTATGALIFYTPPPHVGAGDFFSPVIPPEFYEF